MALEAVIFQQDPFIYGYKDCNFDVGLNYGFGLQEENPKSENLHMNGEQSTTSSSPETPPVGVSRRKRRRSKNLKNKEEMENQRMTHIAVERNRRKQMNDYLAILRTLMPPSYAQRGDQASIVGGAINYVKELEQLLQFLEAHNPTNQQHHPNATNYSNHLFSNFFRLPQYSTCPVTAAAAVDAVAERQSDIADIEVTMVESHANIKVSSKKRPKQLIKMVAGFQSICLTILHLNITTVDQSALYSFSVKVEEECQLTTVNEIATAVHDMLGMIQEEYSLSS
ncbi:hypothetical protein RD792_008565 [Penstemon davidsonii]|uniref:BHLH domain-containing protein n=1 Tax=Penstemon davidsonii TaxID=160366 RepID=A0ABR0D9H2_9LAMI|nr:hypothetical protein RD792_008565 [Penstemon davidsonii]